MNVALSEMHRMAEAENKRARQHWGDEFHVNTKGKNILDRVKPFIGSGKSLTQVDGELDCSLAAVHQSLKKLGAKL